MIDIIFGVNIVEIVTSGLYPNALDSIREYIQNSCDAIDDAIDAGTLREGDGEIDIDIDKKARRIIFKDNGSGLGTRYFESTMSTIGNSDKTLQTDRGFRGIGRLGGVAYCKTLVFSTKVAGEKKISTLIIKAEEIRKTFFSKKKYLAEQVLSANMFFDAFDTDDADEHFFRIEMIDVINNALLDVKKVREYLSFTVPVTYSPQFTHQKEIYKHAAELGFKITEYKIEVNGEPLVKLYSDKFTTQKGEDKIFGVDFRDFRDADGNLIAWSWIGLSTFKGIIQQTKANPNLMRGIRLRAGNIQIGNQYALQKLFTEDRGTTYFIGEVHTVDTNLTPNSRRDYLEENPAYKTFEDTLKKYFDELYDIYHTASDIRSAIKAITEPDEVARKFQQGRSPFKNKAELEAELNELNKKADEKKRYLDKAKHAAEQNPDTPLSRVVSRMIDNTPPPTPPPPPEPTFPPKHWNKNLRKLYNKIKGIILANKQLNGEKLLDKIESELVK